tara:strand:- start:102 stop:485 length:384 start_codon:yes stop_codon:yes gene_type:complete
MKFLKMKNGKRIESEKIMNRVYIRSSQRNDYIDAWFCLDYIIYKMSGKEWLLVYKEGDAEEICGAFVNRRTAEDFACEHFQSNCHIDADVISKIQTDIKDIKNTMGYLFDSYNDTTEIINKFKDIFR